MLCHCSCLWWYPVKTLNCEQDKLLVLLFCPECPWFRDNEVARSLPALSVGTGVKAFSCSICSASFTTNGSLTRHMATHMSLKPYKCPFCEEGFRTAIHCKKHMKRHQAVSSATSTAADTEGGGSFCFGLKVYWSNANLVMLQIDLNTAVLQIKLSSTLTF